MLKTDFQKFSIWSNQIMAIFLAVASAGPVPKSFGIDGMGQRYYPYPEAYLGGNYPGQPLPQYVPLPGDFIMEQQPAPSYVNPVSMNARRYGEQQGIQLMLTVPSAVPPGTSVSVTVNVNSEANGGTVVSVSNPVISAAAPVPVTQEQPEAIVVDSNGTIKGS